jgi:GntR family transcriptional regulator
VADPLWKRIAEELRQKIESGELGREGAPLPSELELQDRFDASRNTIREAVKWLVSRGLVETRPGQGTFVLKTIDPFITKLSTSVTGPLGGEGAAYGSEVAETSRKPSTSDPRIEIQKATGLVAHELGLSASDTIVSRHQERFIDETPWSLQTTFYPMSLVIDGARRLIEAEEILPGAVEYIEETIDIKRSGRRDRFTIRSPKQREIQFFDLPDDGRVSVVEISQTLYDKSGPFAVTITTYPSDRNQFVMTIGDAPVGETPAAPSPTDASEQSTGENN